MTDYGRRSGVGDDVLVRYLDDEATDEERTRVERLDAASAERTRLWQLREASDLLSGLLEDFPLPEAPSPRVDLAGPRAPRMSLKAAAVAFLVLAGAVTAMPVTRTLVARAAYAVSSWMVQPEGGVRPEGGAPATVTFPLASAELRVDVEHAQTAGSLVITRASRGQMAVDVAATAELVVLPGVLLVRNRPDSEGDITMRVPERLATVEVVVAGEHRSVSLSARDDFVRLPLGVRPPS